jgi:hypothetical protein
MSIILDACQVPRARWSPTPDRSTTDSASSVALHCASNVSSLSGAFSLTTPSPFPWQAMASPSSSRKKVQACFTGITGQVAWHPATFSVTYCRLRSRNADFEQSIFASKRRGVSENVALKDLEDISRMQGTHLNGVLPKYGSK